MLSQPKNIWPNTKTSRITASIANCIKKKIFGLEFRDLKLAKGLKPIAKA